MANPDPEIIAKELTEGQRYAVIAYMPERGRWRRCGLVFWALEQLGLVRRRKNPGGSVSCRATPLGLAVRAVLLAQAGVTRTGGDGEAGSVAEGDSTRSEGCAPTPSPKDSPHD
jgi:hypothetical protein